MKQEISFINSDDVEVSFIRDTAYVCDENLVVTVDGANVLYLTKDKIRALANFLEMISK